MLRIGLLIILINLGQWGFLFCPCSTQHFLHCQSNSGHVQKTGADQGCCCLFYQRYSNSVPLHSSSTPCPECPCHSRTEHSSFPISRTLQTRLHSKRPGKHYCVGSNISRVEIVSGFEPIVVRTKHYSLSLNDLPRVHLACRLRC